MRHFHQFTAHAGVSCLRGALLYAGLSVLLLPAGCRQPSRPAAVTADSTRIHLVTLDPGHFHAALVQKEMYPQIDATVHVYAPEGPDVKGHLGLITRYNTRADHPTAWKEVVYTGPDYLEKMLHTEKPGSVVVIAGNNRKKTEYIRTSVNAGMHVLADKPMAVTVADFDVLKDAFQAADKNHVLLYDIMTSRYEITNVLQKAFSQLPAVFGTLQKGTEKDPGMTIVRTHYFLKTVSGAPLIRPVWYFDVAQEGNGIVDVTTHLVDLVQWECCPDSLLDYKKDITMLSARQWATPITPSAFKQITQSDTFPAFLQQYIRDTVLQVLANGEMNYTIKGVHARITMIWDVQPPQGSGDTHYACIRGSRATLVIRQGKEQHYQPTLYIEPTAQEGKALTQAVLDTALQQITAQYPGVTLQKAAKGWEVVIPEKYNVGHEQHFAAVMKQYLDYLRAGKVPEQQVAYMLAKYYTTTQALEKSTIK